MMLLETYHGYHSQVEHNGRENEHSGPLLELVNSLFITVASVVLLGGELYSAADKVMSHSSGHGCGRDLSFEVNENYT